MWIRGITHSIGRGTLCVLGGLAAVVSCSASPEPTPTTPSPPQPPAPATPLVVQCTRTGTSCPAITITGDPVATTPTFRGYADAAVVRDPRVASRLWLTYTYLEGRPATSSTGQLVGVPHTATHLAQSTDGGTTWTYVSRLWNSGLAPDPEGMGPPSYLGSETPSLAAATEGQTVRWYGARLQYFLEPVSAYLPRYSTSWVLRVATATGDSPAVLATAPEAVLGVSSTASVYGPTARLTALAPSLAACGIWNNPSITVEAGRLFVVTECLEFDGGQVSDARSRVVVFSTVPIGAPGTWVWRFDGVLADRALAVELGAARLVSANVSRTEDAWALSWRASLRPASSAPTASSMSSHG
jgi:hypothetical protein